MPQPAQPTAPAEPTPTTSWRQKTLIAGVILGCMLGVVLISQLMLMQQSIRLDESQSIWQASRSLAGTLELVAQDVHMPLYHILLHFWIAAFGNAIEVVRLPSLLFFLASIPAVYLLGRQILPRSWALFAVVLFSFSPFMNWYGNEARMYTLLALLSILNQYFFVKMARTGKGWLGYGLTALVGVYSHYFFAFNLITQGLFFLANRSKFPKGSFKKFVLLAGLIALEILPWAIYFVAQGAASNTKPHLAAPSSVDFFNVYSQFLFGFQNDAINTILVSCWPLLVVVGFFAVKRYLRFSLSIGYLMAAAFVPVVLAFLLSLTISPFFLSRYMVPAIAPLYLLAVWLLSTYSKRWALLIAAGMLVIMSLTFTHQLTATDTPVKEDYRSVVQTIEGSITPRDMVVISSPFTLYPFMYYYNGPASVRTLPTWDPQLGGGVPVYDEVIIGKQLDVYKKTHQYIYLVMSYDQGYQEKLKNYFDAHFERTGQKHFSADISLYVYRVNYSAAAPLGAQP